MGPGFPNFKTLLTKNRPFVSITHTLTLHLRASRKGAVCGLRHFVPSPSRPKRPLTKNLPGLQFMEGSLRSRSDNS